MEVGEVVFSGVAEVVEAFEEVGGGHFVVKVEDVGWGLGWASEDGFACGEGCGAGEGDVAFAFFADGEEGGLSASGDEWVGDPVFGFVVLVPEVLPVDEL